MQLSIKNSFKIVGIGSVFTLGVFAQSNIGYAASNGYVSYENRFNGSYPLSRRKNPEGDAKKANEIYKKAIETLRCDWVHPEYLYNEMNPNPDTARSHFNSHPVQTWSSKVCGPGQPEATICMGHQVCDMTVLTSKGKIPVSGFFENVICAAGSHGKCPGATECFESGGFINESAADLVNGLSHTQKDHRADSSNKAE